nr:uncharacterized protein LOC107455448 [Parasteatoda tepidariorum]
MLEQEIHPNSIDFTLHPSRICEHINDRILFCAKKCIPRVRVMKYRCFWSEELQYMKTKRNRLGKKAELAHRLSDTQAWRRQSALFRKTVLVEKRKPFNDFIAGANDQRDGKKVFKFLSNIKNGGRRAPTQPFQVANKTITTDTEIANAFVKHFTNTHQKNTHSRVTSRFLKRKLKSLLTDFDARPSAHPIFNSFLSVEELTQAINCLKSGKSPGENGIHSEFLQHLGICALNTLLEFFIIIWDSGIVPSQWRRAIVIPIHKKDKSPKNLTYLTYQYYEKNYGKNRI